jgi:hypothetical protein
MSGGGHNMLVMLDRDSVALARARGRRWMSGRKVRTIEGAGRFVNDVGFAVLFPTDQPIAPSLWEVVAKADAIPFADGMGAAESMVWTWKDAMPDAGLAWSGAFAHKRASLLSPRVLTALYPGDGDLDDHRFLPLEPDAHRIADALMSGPLPSSVLRELIGHRYRYDRAMRLLQSMLLVTSAGTQEQRSGWPAVVIDLTCRRFALDGGRDHRYATARFLDTMIQAAPEDLARTFRWSTALARARLDDLVDAGMAVRESGRYRGDRDLALLVTEEGT